MKKIWGLFIGLFIVIHGNTLEEANALYAQAKPLYGTYGIFNLIC